MTPEPRNESDYSQRQTMAARRVLVDASTWPTSTKTRRAALEGTMLGPGLLMGRIG